MPRIGRPSRRLSRIRRVCGSLPCIVEISTTRRLPGSPEPPGPDRSALDRRGRSCGSRRRPGGVAGRRPRTAVAGARLSDRGGQDRGRQHERRADAGSRSGRPSHGRGEVGVGEDQDADHHAEVRQQRQPRPVAPASRRRPRGRGVPWPAASAPGSAARTMAVSHQKAIARMPIERPAEHGVLRRHEQRRSTGPGRSTPATKWASGRRRLIENRPAAASPPRRSRVSTIATAARRREDPDDDREDMSRSLP